MTRHAALPVAVGYVAVPGHARAGEVAGLVDGRREALAGLSGSRGHVFGPVFTDIRGRGESGLYDLVGCLRWVDAVAVVVRDDGQPEPDQSQW